MSSAARDPKGYYAILGLAPGAGTDEIRAAFRRRAKALHPDRNPSPAARADFAKLTEAHAILRNSATRAEYDVGGEAIETPKPTAGIPAALSFIACGRCGHITAQPRFVVFHRVKSFLVWAKTSRVEGIFCRDCADRVAARVSTATWAWGWWSPAGLVLTPLALVRNLLGGTRPAAANATILLHQARAFLARGDRRLARALVRQAQHYTRTRALRHEAETLLAATDPSGDGLRDRWRPWRGGAFLPQLMPLLALPLAIGIILSGIFRPWTHHAGTSAEILVTPPALGETRFVAVDGLKVRQAPTDSAPVLTLLNRFTAVTTVAVPQDPAWVEIRMPGDGGTGFVPLRALYGGAEAPWRRQWCQDHRGAPPEPGEVLINRASGWHQIMINNSGRNDAVVKFKTLAGTTLLAYYLPGAFHLAVAGLPDGTYRVEFATGSQFSRGCGLFIQSMHAAALPFTLTLRHAPPAQYQDHPVMPEITLTPPPASPQQPYPIAIERFLAGD